MASATRKLPRGPQPALVAEVADRLRGGQLVVLPTETVYGLAVLPSHAGAVARARALKERPEDQHFTWHLAARDDARALVGAFSPRIERLVRRYWPGPLTIIANARAGGTAGLRLPAHDFTRAVIAAAGEPLWLSSCNRRGEPPLVDAPAIASALGHAVDLVIDDGPSPIGSASTIVRTTGQKLEVLREGILSAQDVFAAAADLIVFVCTGNTCRSPLAEALAREATAKALACAPGDVLAHGYAFASAGTGTLDGMPASEGSLAAGLEQGLDLSSHQSRAVDGELLAAAARIYCLADSHRRALLAEFPECAPKVALLRQDQLDVRDPYGADLRVYRKVRDEIRAAVEVRSKEWLAG